MNLGTLYWQRVAGHRSDNRERAIAAFEDALSVLTRETNPEGWAAAAMNFGIAYRVCAADEGSDRRDRAIEASEEALSVWTRDSKPTAWAAARMQLGGAYLENSAGDRKGNLEQAIAALELTSLGILALTHSAIFNAQFWLLWVLTLPAVLLGSSAGVALYRRVRPRRATTPARPLQGTSPFH
jgi:hypothetical protein